MPFTAFLGLLALGLCSAQNYPPSGVPTGIYPPSIPSAPLPIPVAYTQPSIPPLSTVSAPAFTPTHSVSQFIPGPYPAPSSAPTIFAFAAPAVPAPSFTPATVSSPQFIPASYPTPSFAPAPSFTSTASNYPAFSSGPYPSPAPAPAPFNQVAPSIPVPFFQPPFVASPLPPPPLPQQPPPPLPLPPFPLGPPVVAPPGVFFAPVRPEAFPSVPASTYGLPTFRK